MNTEQERRRNGSGILSDPDGLSCDASLGAIVRGDVRDIQSWLTDIEPTFSRHGLKLVYKTLFPGRLTIIREAIVETDTVTEGERHGLD